MNYSQNYPPLNPGHLGSSLQYSGHQFSSNHISFGMTHARGNTVHHALPQMKQMPRVYDITEKNQVPANHCSRSRETETTETCSDGKSESSVEMKTEKHDSEGEENEKLSGSRSSSPNTSTSTSGGTSPKSRDASMPERSPSSDSKSSDSEEIKVACKIFFSSAFLRLKLRS